MLHEKKISKWKQMCNKGAVILRHYLYLWNRRRFGFTTLAHQRKYEVLSHNAHSDLNRHFIDNIFKCIFFNKNVCIWIRWNLFQRVRWTKNEYLFWYWLGTSSSGMATYSPQAIIWNNVEFLQPLFTLCCSITRYMISQLGNAFCTHPIWY